MPTINGQINKNHNMWKKRSQQKKNFILIIKKTIVCKDDIKKKTCDPWEKIEIERFYQTQIIFLGLVRLGVNL